MKIFFLAFASLIVFCQIIFAQNNSPKGFAVYLLPGNIKSNQLSKINLKKLKPTGKPLISESEIQYYQKENHEFRIDYIASDRIKKINDLGGTKPFAVFVGNEAIYVGAFWKSILSSTFDGVIINTFKAVGNPPYYSGSDYPVLTLELGYPSTEYFKSTDLRADSRIFKALEEAGKLYEEVELNVTCSKIIGTGKRRMSYIFTLPVVSVSKGEFDEKEITLELYDGKMLAEFDAERKVRIGENTNFDQKQQVTLKLSKQVGKEKPDWFLIDYRKK
jgi:hypothetical protein